MACTRRPHAGSRLRARQYSQFEPKALAVMSNLSVDN
jgi:hypothetical protein